MKTILLMRHGKGDWKDKDTKDRKRPLTKRGRRNAAQMGEFIKERELIPQIILTSPAVRAEETAKIFAESCGFQGEIRPVKDFYMAEADEYLKELRRLPDDVERVMVVGHNPGLESLIPLLTDQIESLPTSAIAYIVLTINSWKDLNKKTEAELVALWRPKEIE
jgi:phosphohistidine phosphatase